MTHLVARNLLPPFAASARGHPQMIGTSSATTTTATTTTTAPGKSPGKASSQLHLQWQSGTGHHRHSHSTSSLPRLRDIAAANTSDTSIVNSSSSSTTVTTAMDFPLASRERSSLHQSLQERRRYGGSRVHLLDTYFTLSDIQRWNGISVV